jgi:CO dehydrogenase maturation factor
MKIAVVGKGGSGKSTISWLLVNQLSRKNNVLAIDADYNMDLVHNLGSSEDISFLNHSEKDFYAYQSLASDELYANLPKRTNLKKFSFSPNDTFTEKYAREIKKNISLMAGGRFHEDSLYGQRCSHAYLAPLKYYLSLLTLPSNSFVIIDSVAGTDMVAYGLYLGVDAVICSVEPNKNSMNVFHQIKMITTQFDIPLFIVINKSLPSPEMDEFKKKYKLMILGEIPIDAEIIKNNMAGLSQKTKEALEDIEEAIKKKLKPATNVWNRLVAWRENYELQQKSQLQIRLKEE